MWWETESGQFVNLRGVQVLEPHDEGDGTWTVWAYWDVINDYAFRLKGSYASEQDASRAARQLVHGIDPANITGAAS